MKVTISTHNGSAAHREHNIRMKCVASKQPHIHTDGIYEIWKDESARQAYHRIFDDAVERYNARQKREDRKIKNYYSQIEKDEKKHPVYEMIIGIYGKDEYGYPVCSHWEGYEIMKEFFRGWEDRNPNLELIGAYYHADEDGEPHVHLDYIPVAHGYKNGMDTQNGLVKALGEMGFFKSGKRTAQIQWEARENQLLEDLCRSKNLLVSHPEKDGSRHLHTDLYKAKQELEQTNKNLETARTESEQAEKQIVKLQMEEQLARDAAEAAKKEKQKAIRDADDAKIRGNVFEEAQKALERTKAECASPPVQILKETEGKNGLFGSTEATVTIRRKDFDRLQQNERDVRHASSMYENVLKTQDKMQDAATVLFTNLADSEEIALNWRIRRANEEIKHLNEIIAGLKEERARAFEEIRNAKLNKTELMVKLYLYSSVLRFFPWEWEKMLEQTKPLREMESVYEKSDFRYRLWSSDRYLYINGREVSEKKFLEDYVRECRKHDFEPKLEMKARLSELEKNIDLHSSLRL